MATTTNYSWTTPDDTDLVKDGAAAIRTLGSSADTTVKNLNPGTTAGDIDYYTSGTAKARIAIGTAGQVLQVNSGATAPEWATPAGAAFKGAFAYNNDNSLSISPTTLTVIPLQAEDFDTDTFHSTVTNTERMTIPAGLGGYYLINWTVQWESAGRYEAGIFKNGSIVYTPVVTTTAFDLITGSTILNLVATDYIDMRVYNYEATAKNVKGSAYGNGKITQVTIQYLGA